MKYKIERIDDDTTRFSYKDKSFEAKRDIQLIRDIEGVEQKARIKLIADLKEQGMTINDLVVEKKVGNKTYEDRSNVIELEEHYVQIMRLQLYEDYCKKWFNMGLEELMLDIGINDDEATQLGFDMAKLIRGIEEETPSNKKEDKGEK